jgi:uncharacterized damage-inducible protein DinB
MKESDRIITLYQKLYDGKPWLGINLKSTLQNVSAKQASTRILANCNTIWEIVNHIISWRRVVIERINGMNITTPENNYIEPIVDTSDRAWKDTLQRLESSQAEWIEFLKNFKSEDFDTEYKSSKLTYYELIHGIIQHDAYHLGQIVIFAKQAD